MCAYVREEVYIDGHVKMRQLEISVEAAPQFLMYASDTLEAHAPGSIMTFISSDT